jgi:hypothetical protein
MQVQKLPFVLIFDIDNAIIGNIDICNKEYNLLNLIFNVCKKKNIHDIQCGKNLLDFDIVMKEGLLRPNAKEFIDFCKDKYKNVELFVYTNSSYAWTNNALIKNIERSLGHKFNKPYFTRENSLQNGFKKSLSNVYDSILHVLVSKYPSMKNKKNQEEVFNNRLIMIDDVQDNLFDFSSKLIKCPEYKYKPYYDLYMKIIDKYRIPREVFDNADILNFFDDNFLPIYNMNGSKQQKDMVMYNLISLWNIRQSELSKSSDTFFVDLMKIMDKYPNTHDENIKMINQELVSLPSS